MEKINLLHFGLAIESEIYLIPQPLKHATKIKKEYYESELRIGMRISNYWIEQKLKCK